MPANCITSPRSGRLAAAALTASLVFAPSATARTHYRAGQSCDPHKQRTYHRYGYRCVNVGDPAYTGDNYRLQRLPKKKHHR